MIWSTLVQNFIFSPLKSHRNEIRQVPSLAIVVMLKYSLDFQRIQKEFIQAIPHHPLQVIFTSEISFNLLGFSEDN